MTKRIKCHGVAAGMAFALLASIPARAEDAPPPPYLMTEANTVTIAVQWNADSLKPLLPAGIVPVDDMSGGLNVYTAERGYGLSPYSAAYAYVNVTGWDTVQGGPARHIIGGWYGPDAKVAAAMRQHFGAEVETGQSSQRAEGDTWIGEGGDDGDGRISLVIKPGTDCVAAAGTLNYVAPVEAGAGLGLLQIPFEGQFCPGEAVSVEIEGPEGSPLGTAKVAAILGGGQLKAGAFAFVK
jgi:hypothetical protein